MKLNLVILFALLGAFAQASTKDLELIKLACSDPGSIQEQNPPSDININCTGNKVVWNTTVDDPTLLNQTGKVTSSITTNKPEIGATTVTLPVLVPPVQAGCTTYAKTEMEASSSYMVTCDEILAITDVSEWCFNKLTQEGQTNPSVWTSVQSGETFNPCDQAEPGTSTEPSTSTFF